MQELATQTECAHEWILQRQQIARGEKTWDDFTFEERTCRGWLLPYLFELEGHFWGRWDYWLSTLEAGKLLDEPIPQIRFSPSAMQNKKPIKMLTACLDKGWISGIYEAQFFEWILWGFHDFIVKERPKIPDKLNEYWYRTFDIGMMLEDPYDYLGQLLADQKYAQGSGYYPTPHNVVEMMTRMTIADKPQLEHRHLTVCDPCVGTGRMLLHASNFSLRLYGVDINYGVLLGCLVNGWLYAPWMVKPGDGTVKWPDDAKPAPEPFEETRNVVVLNKKQQISLF